MPFHGLNSVLKSLVRWVNSSEDSVSTAHEVMKIFLLFYMSLCYGPYTSQYFGVLAWNCLFMPPSGEFLGHLFSPWRHPSSLPLEGLFLGGNTSFEPFSVTISATVRPRRVMKKKGQHNKKVTKVLYSLFFGGGEPHWTDSAQKMQGGWCPQRDHVCQVSNWNFHGLRFYRRWNFRFTHWF